MSRAYLRTDPALYERKVVEQGYPLPLFAAFVGTLCLAEHQPKRGRFRNDRVLRALLGPAARFVPELIRRCDLIVQDDGSLYVDGWEEWQEGDWKVGERVSRIRSRTRRKSVTVPNVTPVTVPTVDTPSDGDCQSVIDGGGIAEHTPLPPSRGGRRADATNPRAIAAELTRRSEEAERQRKARRIARQRAYLDGRITEAQRDDMNDRDADLEEIPTQRGAAYQGLPA